LCGLQGAYGYPEKITDIDIALQRFIYGVGPYHGVRTVFIEQHISDFRVGAATPGDRGCGVRIVGDAEHNMVGCRRGPSVGFYETTVFIKHGALLLFCFLSHCIATARQCQTLKDKLKVKDMLYFCLRIIGYVV
jgi:hypothetical protein